MARNMKLSQSLSTPSPPSPSLRYGSGNTIPQSPSQRAGLVGSLSAQVGNARTECARIPQQRCPACFSTTIHGRTGNQGADFVVSTDGNFSQRHMASAGDCPKFYEPSYFLPKEFVDNVGARIDAARPKRRRGPVLVPDEAVDQCESGHIAGKGTNTKQFDDGGVMALICRHDIPLFLVNIDTPGEQQKYPVALVEHLFTLIPDRATVAILYDVACVLERSLQKFDFLPDDILAQTTFGTTAMHAYGHQWSCQLVYNPRLREGFGLSDGEGTERLWSKLRKLISITRQSSVSTVSVWLLCYRQAPGPS